MTILKDPKNNYSTREQILSGLRSTNIDFSFNTTPERYLSRSLTQTKLQRYIDCPHCFFKKKATEIETKPHVMLSNTIHYLGDYLIRNQQRFPNSHSVLNFINFSEGDLLEELKTDEENSNYDILAFLADITDPKIKEIIIRGALIIYGTSKRLGFQEVRKKDALSVNLQNLKNKSTVTLYTKPDYTGRHKTIFPKTSRTFDNFVIDFKLNFTETTKSNSLQMAFYYLTHELSRRNIHNYLVLDITSGNLYRMSGIDLNPFYSLINKFLILRNLNFRGKNNNHLCNDDADVFSNNFLDDLNISEYGASFGTQVYYELLSDLKKLESSIEFTNLGQIIRKEELDTVLNLYPIKID